MECRGGDVLRGMNTGLSVLLREGVDGRASRTPPVGVAVYARRVGGAAAPRQRALRCSGRMDTYVVVIR